MRLREETCIHVHVHVYTSSASVVRVDYSAEGPGFKSQLGPDFSPYTLSLYRVGGLQ